MFLCCGFFHHLSSLFLGLSLLLLGLAPFVRELRHFLLTYILAFVSISNCNVLQRFISSSPSFPSSRLLCVATGGNSLWVAGGSCGIYGGCRSTWWLAESGRSVFRQRRSAASPRRPTHIHQWKTGSTKTGNTHTTTMKWGRNGGNFLVETEKLECVFESLQSLEVSEPWDALGPASANYWAFGRRAPRCLGLSGIGWSANDSGTNHLFSLWKGPKGLRCPKKETCACSFSHEASRWFRSVWSLKNWSNLQAFQARQLGPACFNHFRLRGLSLKTLVPDAWHGFWRSFSAPSTSTGRRGIAVECQLANAKDVSFY